MGSGTSKSVSAARKPCGLSHRPARRSLAAAFYLPTGKRGAEASPRSVSTACPSGSPGSSPAVDPGGAEPGSAGLTDEGQDAGREWARVRYVWQKVQESVRCHCHDPDDLQLAVHIWELWGLDVTLEPDFARKILKVLLRVLRLYHMVEFPDGDVAWVLAHAVAFGHQLGFAQRAREAAGHTDFRSACAAGRADFCAEVAMVFFLAQTHLCDEPCFAPTYLQHVFAPRNDGRSFVGPVDQRSLNRAIIRCFQGLQFRLDVARPILVVFYRSLGGPAAKVAEWEAEQRARELFLEL